MKLGDINLYTGKDIEIRSNRISEFFEISKISEISGISRISGQISKLSILLVLVLSSFSTWAQEDPRGEWFGAIEIFGNELDITCRFGLDTMSKWHGDIDIPAQKVYGVALSTISLDGNNYHFELETPMGVALFTSNVKGNDIKGTFVQGTLEAPFYLRRDLSYNAPYSESRVQFSSDSLTLSGTLLIPDGDGPHPAVVLLSDKGAQDRDGTVFGFRPLRILADHLSRNGIAVLRFDDRGYGQSEGMDVMAYTVNELTADVTGAVDLLRGREDISPDQVGLVGFGEGAITAINHASVDEYIAYIVLAAAPLNNGKVNLREYYRRTWDLQRLSVSERAQASQLLEDLLISVETGRDWDYLRSELQREALADIDNMSEVKRGSIPDLNNWMQAQVSQRIQQVDNPWFKSRMLLEPAEAIKVVRCPVLALFAKHDLNAPSEMQIPKLISSMESSGNMLFQIETFEDANHTFQLYNAALIKEDEFAFVKGFKEAIAFWIQATTPAAE